MNTVLMRLAARRKVNHIDLQPLKRILIFRLGKLGDLAASSWFFKTLRQNFPYQHVTLITLPLCEPLLKPNTDLDDIFYFDRKKIFSLIRRVHREKFDVIIDLNDNPSRTSVLASMLFGVPLATAFGFSETEAAFNFTVEPPDKQTTHILERTATLAKALNLNFDINDLRPCVALDAAALADVQVDLALCNKNFLIGFNLSAGLPLRYWQAEKWRELAERLFMLSPKLQLLFLSKPDDARLLQSVTATLPKDRFTIPKHGTFQHFASYIHEISLLVSPDTSAIHIASAFQVPVVGLYPNVKWNYASWRPFGTRYETILSSTESVVEIETDDVFEKTTMLLRECFPTLFNP
jgi:ADP-heptose:LPS heptosyltransferase